MLLKIIRCFSLLILKALIIIGCNGNNVPDCLQAAGDIIREERVLANFDKITVFENITLIVKQGPLQQVAIETGANLMAEVTAEVTDGTLVLTDSNDCNFFRDYGITKVYVTAPNIRQIRSSTGFPIRSDGVLAYQDLTLFSESFNVPEAATTDGSFVLELASESIQVVANGIAYFQLSGVSEELNVTIAAGDSRVDAKTLIASKILINHRGSNDISIHPQQLLKGVIRGTGDVVSHNRPDTVDVEVLYRGKLIFVN